MTHDDYVRQIRAIGESLIKNAESIVGSEKYLMSIYISANIGASAELPSISVTKDFYPEKVVEENND